MFRKQAFSEKNRSLVAIVLGLLVLLPKTIALGQSSVTVTTSGASTTITEPGRISLAKLFQMSDVVAVVKVLSGDTENYPVALYKAEVVKAFKGVNNGSTLYFGPFVGERLGDETMVFLVSSSSPATPKDAQHAPYGTVKYFNVFNEGYSRMTISYNCLFDGKEIAQQCDYGVRVCRDYIVLPKQTQTFPPQKEEAAFGCRWVRKSTFESLLDKLSH